MPDAPLTPYSSDIAFTASVKDVQTKRGSRKAYARMEQQHGGFQVDITDELASYIAARDSAYLATANSAGQPYVQHRGGRKGFIRVLDRHTIGFADFVGNKQFITTGNLAENDRAFLFLMDYEHRTRIKLWGRAKVVTGDRKLSAALVDDDDDTRVQQAIVFAVEAWDVNCPQHIPQLIHASDVAARHESLERRIAYLEQTLRAADVAFEEGAVTR